MGWAIAGLYLQGLLELAACVQRVVDVHQNGWVISPSWSWRERERVIIQENKQAAPHQVISTYTLFPLIILLVTPVQRM